jgi:hypothetical protein
VTSSTLFFLWQLALPERKILLDILGPTIRASQAKSSASLLRDGLSGSNGRCFTGAL